MMLQEGISLLAQKFNKLAGMVNSEEATKNAFVLPFLEALGYDVYNPLEIVPEMDCDIAKRGDKVDYAICIEGNPIIIVECKQLDKNLDYYYNQLAKYYVATTASYAILTNGKQYRFYTDFDRKNIMDKEPFFNLNINEASADDFEILSRFSKSGYNDAQTAAFVGNMILQNKVETFITECVCNPSKEFISFVVRSLNEGKCNKELIKQYTPSIKFAIQRAFAGEAKKPAIGQNLSSAPSFEATEDEIRAYAIINDILQEYVERGDLTYTSLKSYFSINFRGTWKWVIRLKLRDDDIKVCFPHTDYSGNYKSDEWVRLSSLQELYQLKDKIIFFFNLSSK